MQKTFTKRAFRRLHDTCNQFGSIYSYLSSMYSGSQRDRIEWVSFDYSTLIKLLFLSAVYWIKRSLMFCVIS